MFLFIATFRIKKKQNNDLAQLHIMLSAKAWAGLFGRPGGRCEDVKLDISNTTCEQIPRCARDDVVGG
jgi:hypothetical protein